MAAFPLVRSREMEVPAGLAALHLLPLLPNGRNRSSHHNFLGASNLYRELFAAEVHIHRVEPVHEISPLPFLCHV
jgi:hypothetical protein